MNPTPPQNNNRNNWWHISALIITICFAYLKILHAPFSSWDDGEYIISNSDVHGFSFEHISAWFSRFYIGNYHPLTMFSYAADFTLGKQEPLIYHLSNLLLHITNALVLYFFITRLQQNRVVALFTALVFALHPCQTESVSWIAERKTLLCCFFYFVAMYQYASYISKPTAGGIVLILLSGIAAMLSKGVGVVLPVSLLAVHLWMSSGINIKKFLPIFLPLLFAAVTLGTIAIMAQDSGKFLNLHPYSLTDTMLLAADAYTRYIIHLLLPVHLSVIYPYPAAIGSEQYACFLIAASILTLSVVAWRRKWIVLCGGILFYTVNIALVLQFIHFGEYLMADRYIYIAGVGVIFPLVFYTVTWLQKKEQKKGAIAFWSVIVLALNVGTFFRNNIWMSELAFTNSMLKEFPESAAAQYNVGALYLREGNYKEAELHMNKAVQLDPLSYKAWYNMGILYLKGNNINAALNAFNKSIELHQYPEAYFNRALIYMATGRSAAALADAEKVLETQPTNARAWYIKANSTEQLGNITSSIEYYSKAIFYEGTEPLFYLHRGLAYTNTGQYKAASLDIEKALRLDSSNATAYYYRGILKYKMGLPPCDDFRTAITKGYKAPHNVMQKLCN